MDATVVALVGWITAHSSLAFADPPRITFVPHHRMVEGFPGANRLSPFLRLESFYDAGNTTIVLPDTWRPSELRDQSVLLHELVHHAQRTSEIIESCPGSLERQAYHLQITWLREQGVTEPYALIGTNALVVLMLGACGE